MEVIIEFLDELTELPFRIIKHMVFKDRTVTIEFRSGNILKATCPDGNDQYEILKAEALKNLAKENVEIHDN